MRLIPLTLAVPTVFNPMCTQRIFKGITRVFNRGLAKSSCRPPLVLFSQGLDYQHRRLAAEEADVVGSYWLTFLFVKDSSTTEPQPLCPDTGTLEQLWMMSH